MTKQPEFGVLLGSLLQQRLTGPATVAQAAGVSTSELEAGLSLPQPRQAVYDHTFDADMVQIGNKLNGGIAVPRSKRSSSVPNQRDLGC